MTEKLVTAANRRDVIMSANAAATAIATSAWQANRAEAAEAVRTMALRGHSGGNARQPTLALESKGDFYAGMAVWRGGELERAAEARADEICKAAGIDPNSKDVTWGQAVSLLADDPLIAMTCRARSSHQKLKYQLVQNYYHQNADQFLAEMERADKMGPGSLELNPKMDIPEYTAHEIHSMPGGYVGDEFAGHMYHAGTDWGVYVAFNTQGGALEREPDRFIQMASNSPAPKDGKVKRVLEIGTSIGQFASGMKHRFPEAEVWGVDVGGPMVRYAHMRAADEGVAVNFAQRLGEDTKFPDNYFDLVVTNLLFHEVNQTGAKGIIKEVSRILRPGGVFAPTDTNTMPPTVKGKYTLWYNYRWNHEDWHADWHSLDFTGEMKKNGLSIDADMTKSRHNAKIVATKV